MKRCWFGGGLLVCLLVLGLLSGMAMARFCRELSREASRAAALAEEDRQEAQEILSRAAQRWHRRRFFLRALANHEPIREADTLFALLAAHAPADSFRENALRLAQLLEETGSTQLPVWENIF